MAGLVNNLGSFELEDLARFLLHHMPMETRGKLMETRPVTYVKLFPHTADTVNGKVLSATLTIAAKV